MVSKYFLVFLVFLTIPFVNGYVTEGLVLHYSFDNSTINGVEVFDNTPSERNGTFNAEYGLNCKLSECFNYSLYPAVGAINTNTTSDHTQLRLTNGGTLSAWVYLHNWDTSAPRIIDKSSLGDGKNGYALYTESDGSLTLVVDENASKLTSNAGVLSTDTWTHILVTFNNTYASIWVDGVNETNLGQLQMPPDVSDVVRIGNFDAGNRNFTGLIDDLSIWNRSLSTTEIASIYNGGSGLAYSGEPFDVVSPSNNTIFFSNQSTHFRIGYNPLDSTVGVSNITLIIVNSSSYVTLNYTENFTTGGAQYFNITYFLPSSDNYTWYVNTTLNDSNTGSTGIYNIAWRPLQGFTINILDYLGDLIDSVYLYATDYISSYANPYYGIYSEFLNGSGDLVNVTLNISDLTYGSIDGWGSLALNASEDEYNFSLDPVKLSFQFYQNWTNNLTGTNGTICQEGTVGGVGGWLDELLNNGCYEFNNISYVQIQSNLSEGRILTKFNWNTSNKLDWVQYYEYYNNQSFNINEQIDLLRQTQLDLIYFEITDRQNRPIEDSTIFSYHENIFGNISKWGLTNRRLTKSDGKTSIYFDGDNVAKLLVYAPNYEPQIKIIHSFDEFDTNTEDNPFEIHLERSTGEFISGVWLGFRDRFWNRSEDIIVNVIAPDYSSVKYLTTYGQDNGRLSENAIEATGAYNDMDFQFTIESQQDFSTSGTDDITVMLYTDNTNSLNFTIEYFDKEDIFDFEDANLDEGTLVVVGALALILVSSLIGWWIASPVAGVTTFIFGGIILALIDSSFM